HLSGTRLRPHRGQPWLVRHALQAVAADRLAGPRGEATDLCPRRLRTRREDPRLVPRPLPAVAAPRGCVRPPSAAIQRPVWRRRLRPPAALPRAVRRALQAAGPDR